MLGCIPLKMKNSSIIVSFVVCACGAPAPSDDGADGAPDLGVASDVSEASDTSDAAADVVADVGVGSPPAPSIPEPDGPCPTFSTGEQTIEGLTTNIVAGVPTETPGPMLFTWHGTGSNGRQSLNAVPESVRDDVVARGGIIIAPNDDGAVRQGQSPNGVWYEGSDLEYADHLVACAVAEHNIDPRQIYVTGCSAGGLMAAAMATQRSSYVAAAYPNSGGSVVPPRLQPGTLPPAALTMHGGASDVVIISFQDASERLQGTLTGLGGFGIDCNHGGRHCGAPRELREAAWRFVNAHPYGTSPSPYASGLPGDLPSYCAIWSN